MKHLHLLTCIVALTFITGSLCAQDTTLTITSSGKVGIGTTTPLGKLEVVGDGSAWHQGFLFLKNDGRDAGIRLYDAPDKVRFHIFNSTSADNMLRIVPDSTYGGGINLTQAGYVGIGMQTPTYPLEMASGAHVTVGGVWTDASSGAYKENISNLSQAEAMAALAGLTPVKYNYKVEQGEEYLGFIAEDVPDLVATNGRKSLSPMDIVAVLTKVVQLQQQKIAELEARLNTGH